MKSAFIPTAQDLFFTRHDATDPRLGEVAKNAALTGAHEPNSWLLAGYPDDEGIQLNGGRIGAASAPDAVRKPFYRMTPALNSTASQNLKICDVGNLNIVNLSLAERHRAVAEAVERALRDGQRWVGLGGGHDYAYADGVGFLASQAARKLGRPLIINFDAHLDVRPIDRGLNSGTPFRRLLESPYEFDLLQIGIQPHCNSQNHFNWCREAGAKILTMDEIELSGESQTQSILQFLSPHIVKERPLFLSLDIDAFSSAHAMGCSQSWPTGLDPSQIMPVMQVLAERCHLQVVGVYEVSPPLDSDQRTAKLAACLLHRLLFSAKV